MEFPKHWMVTNRSLHSDRFGNSRSALTYWTSKGPADRFASWTQVNRDGFHKLLRDAASQFAALPPDENESQQHVSLFIHG